MKRNISALTLNLLAALISFLVGTATQSLRFTSSDSPKENRTPVSVTAITQQIESPKPTFHSSNILRIASMLNQLVESEGRAKTNTFYVEEVNDEQRGGIFTQVYSKEDRSAGVQSTFTVDLTAFPRDNYFGVERCTVKGEFRRI